jgi:D-3-phosphoglycerate dehydrogenase / 2-oxoglutarate reductase
VRLLVTDPISEEGMEILSRDADVQVDMRSNLTQEELVSVIKDYDGIIIRSGTQVTAEVIDAGVNMKVVGRAGVGVDNVDLDYATRKGILVMNTPAANILSAAEHTMAMMLSLARKIVWADSSLKSGRWERKKFTGIELSGKTLGIVGIGRVGGEVAKRAKAFQMRLVGFDPFISPENAVKVGVRLLPLERVLEEADIITVHAPLTPGTRHLIGREELKLLKPTAMILNCARGGIVEEEALYEALRERRIAGAALDVFENEPPVGSKLLELDNIVVTPHLGASTREAQEKVSLEMAEHVKMFLKEGKISNAVNAPRGKVDPRVAPFINIAELLGAFAINIFDAPLRRVQITVCGDLASTDTSMIRISSLIGVLSSITGENTNIINAEAIAKEKGIQVVESKVDECSHYVNMIAITLRSDGQKLEVRGTAFPTDEPRLLGIDEFDIDMPLEGDFIMTIHNDVPGVIGKVGTLLGGRGVNISRMRVGRKRRGERALMLIGVDEPVDKDLLDTLVTEAGLNEARYVRLSLMKPKEYMSL